LRRLLKPLKYLGGFAFAAVRDLESGFVTDTVIGYLQKTVNRLSSGTRLDSRDFRGGAHLVRGRTNGSGQTADAFSNTGPMSTGRKAVALMTS
jgi:hypothetical protein